MLVNIGKIKVLNSDQNASKNDNITLYKHKNKNTLQHLKLGKFKFGIRKIGCSMNWTRYSSDVFLPICFSVWGVEKENNMHLYSKKLQK